MQIYRNDEKQGMAGVFIAIIVTSSLFLWLEFIQVLDDKRRYFSSIYNATDLFAFVLPLIGGLKELFWVNSDGYNACLSFSVPFILLHLNRLRYIESAENLTYDIPGFRAVHDFFPETIYYTATPVQVRDYEKETQRLLEESMLTPISQAKDGQDQQDHLDISSGNGLSTAFMKQYQEDQDRRDEEQRRRDEEQRRRDEEQRRRCEEQEKMIAELRDEVRAWKSQLRQ
ncbi:hypothetical protein BGX29_010257 [Mortierella sp. GBA35]|nr:hypothetical protein BGX29_010257 [Mortierella sp. GBA35]